MFSPFVSLQAFLKSEVSAENILFWQACEKFKKIPAASVDEVRWPIITCLDDPGTSFFSSNVLRFIIKENMPNLETNRFQMIAKLQPNVF